MKTLLSVLSLPLLVVACAGSDPASDDPASEADNLTGAGGGDCMVHSGHSASDIKACAPGTAQTIGDRMTDQFRACFQAGLEQDPRLEGKVTLRVELDKDGKVINSEAEMPRVGLTTEVVSCLANTMRDEKFLDMANPRIVKVILHVPVILKLE